MKPINQSKKLRSSTNINSEEVATNYNKRPDVSVKPSPQPMMMRTNNMEAQETEESSPVASLLIDLSEQEKAEMYSLLKAEFDAKLAMADEGEEVAVEGEEEV